MSGERGLLAALKAISGECTLAGFGRTVARELYALVPGISTSYNEVNPRAPKVMAFIHPEPDEAWWARYTPPFEAHLAQHPVLAHFAATASLGPTTWAQVDPAGAFFDTELYRQFYRPLGIHSQVVVQVPAAHGVVIGIAVNRDGTGFSAEELALLGELREHLANLHRLVVLADRVRLSIELLGLSPRQAEVARLLQEGLTNTQIARRLGISESTVRKHIEAVFTTLGVTSRAGAVARLLTATG